MRIGNLFCCCWKNQPNKQKSSLAPLLNQQTDYLSITKLVECTENLKDYQEIAAEKLNKKNAIYKEIFAGKNNNLKITIWIHNKNLNTLEVFDTTMQKFIAKTDPNFCPLRVPNVNKKYMINNNLIFCIEESSTEQEKTVKFFQREKINHLFEYNDVIERSVTIKIIY